MLLFFVVFKSFCLAAKWLCCC